MTDPPDPSRREFIAMSAMGLVELAGLTRRAAPAGDSVLLYVGTYTEDRAEGIHLVRFDTASGELRLVGAVNAGPNPSFLAVHPNGRVLYAVNEVDTWKGRASGGVSAFAIDPVTGGLTLLGDQSSEGTGPCYVSVDRSGRAALVANYGGGSVALLPILPNGGLAPASAVARHRGTGPDAERQEAAHAHCIIAEPSNRFALAADLGMDRVFVYRLDLEQNALHHVEHGDARLRPGSGPRHIAFHPTLPIVLVASELDSTVTTLRFEQDRGTLSVIETHSTVPTGWSGTSYAADIHLGPLGNTVYVSNRGHDSIAMFTIARASGALALEQVVPTDGDWPRNFSLDPSGRWLLVANQRSGSVVVFARDEATGRLTATKQRLALPSPVCLRFR